MDREKVIKGLEICSEYGSCKDCPYRGCETECGAMIAKDALALLKEHDERIKELEFEKGWDEYPDMMGKW